MLMHNTTNRIHIGLSSRKITAFTVLFLTVVLCLRITQQKRIHLSSMSRNVLRDHLLKEITTKESDKKQYNSITVSHRLKIFVCGQLHYTHKYKTAPLLRRNACISCYSFYCTLCTRSSQELLFLICSQIRTKLCTRYSIVTTVVPTNAPPGSRIKRRSCVKSLSPWISHKIFAGPCSSPYEGESKKTTNIYDISVFLIPKAHFARPFHSANFVARGSAASLSKY